VLSEFEVQALALLVEIRDLLTPKALPLLAPVAPVMEPAPPVDPAVLADVAKRGLAG
jgi:hypothetical protein